MTTATKESKPKKAKKKPDDPPVTETPDVETAGNPDLTGSPENSSPTLLERLAKLGFIVADDDLTDVELLDASEWLDAKDFLDRAVPEFLRDFEAVNAPLTQSALDAGKAKGLAGASENTCPYPPDTILRAYWTDGFKSGATQKEANRKADFEARQKIATDAAKAQADGFLDMNELDEINSMIQEAKNRK